ncbi:MAG: pyridoxamine kinase [Candidatus Onthomonas sp.]
MRRHSRVLSVQDLSCIGQCSLTAALPVLSACGAECCVLPTAVLSTHTGPEFARPHIRDLTGDLEPVWRSWRAQGISFDGIGVGYLASRAQLELAAELIEGLRGPETLVLLDPVMGDNGHFYSGFGPDFARGMGELCAKSDVILPNLTEARFLLGDREVPETYDAAFCRETALALADLGAKWVVLTGLDCIPGQVANLICRCDTGETRLLSQPRLPGSHHGTGDLFAAACLGLLLRGEPLEAAAERAGAFVAAAIRNTEPEHNYGVRFEGCLGLLTGN